MHRSATKLKGDVAPANTIQSPRKSATGIHPTPSAKRQISALSDATIPMAVHARSTIWAVAVAHRSEDRLP